MNINKIEENISWYSEKRPEYEILENKIKEYIERILDLRSAKYHFIEQRTKTIESFEEKISQRGNSFNPKKLHD